MRIVSFLPSATEMVYALGLGEHLVGRTHECDYPPQVREKPVVVRSVIEPEGMSPQQIDEAVARNLRSGQSLYVVDEILLKDLGPDLILTQDLCQVCAPSGNEVGRVIGHLPGAPRIVWLTPTCLADIFLNIKQVGVAANRADLAARVVEKLTERVNLIAGRAARLEHRPRVFCMEWLSPPYSAGHWMPELVRLAGGTDDLARERQPSRRIAWEEILNYSPEVLILSPCGFYLEEVIRQAPLITRYADWRRIPAVQNGRVHAVDANSYFARPGPRIVDGLELLAALIHPEEFVWNGSSGAYRTVDFWGG